MQALDRDTERVSEFVRDVEFKFSIVWYTHLDIDKLVTEALQNYALLDPSDPRGKVSALRVVAELLGRKAYLLAYMGCDPCDQHRDNLERQLVSLKKLVDELAGQLSNSMTVPVAGSTS